MRVLDGMDAAATEEHSQYKKTKFTQYTYYYYCIGKKYIHLYIIIINI